jgi:hypothetical protein
LKADPKKIFDYLDSKFGSELEEKMMKELNYKEHRIINNLIESYRNKTVDPSPHSDDDIFMKYITQICEEINNE